MIPKGPYVSWDDFSGKASDAEIAGFTRAVGRVARDLDLVEPGYRLLANIGQHGGDSARIAVSGHSAGCHLVALTGCRGGLPGAAALVLGSEGEGMRHNITQHCDALARLPISEAMESLNVSNAAAIALSAVATRQSEGD